MCGALRARPTHRRAWASLSAPTKDWVPSEWEKMSSAGGNHAKPSYLLCVRPRAAETAISLRCCLSEHVPRMEFQLVKEVEDKAEYI